MPISIIVVRGSVTTNADGTLTVPATHATKQISTAIASEIAGQMKIDPTPVALLQRVVKTLRDVLWKKRLAEDEEAKIDAAKEKMNRDFGD